MGLTWPGAVRFLKFVDLIISKWYLKRIQIVVAHQREVKAVKL